MENMFTQNIIVGQGYNIALLYTLTSTALARNKKGHSNKSDGDFLGFNGYKYPNSSSKHFHCHE